MGIRKSQDVARFGFQRKAFSVSTNTFLFVVDKHLPNVSPPLFLLRGLRLSSLDRVASYPIDPFIRSYQSPLDHQPNANSSVTKTCVVPAMDKRIVLQVVFGTRTIITIIFSQSTKGSARSDFNKCSGIVQNVRSSLS